MIKACLLATFLGSTPAALAAVYVFGYPDRAWVAILNQYVFATSMVLLYVYPFIVRDKTALGTATMNWIVWLSVFTQATFQIPHNVLTPVFHARRGEPIEWPFFAYSFADARWAQYNEGRGLPVAVQLINWNDALLGIAVGLLLAAHRFWPANNRLHTYFVLLVVFRDATLFRETWEYLFDHHRSGYNWTTQDPVLRPHAIACLWLVNIIWIVAPPLTVVWAARELQPINRAQNHATQAKKKE